MILTIVYFFAYTIEYIRISPQTRLTICAKNCIWYNQIYTQQTLKNDFRYIIHYNFAFNNRTLHLFTMFTVFPLNTLCTNNEQILTKQYMKYRSIILPIYIKYISNIHQIYIKYTSNIHQIYIKNTSNIHQIYIKYTLLYKTAFYVKIELDIGLCLYHIHHIHYHYTLLYKKILHIAIYHHYYASYCTIYYQIKTKSCFD